MVGLTGAVRVLVVPAFTTVAAVLAISSPTLSVPAAVASTRAAQPSGPCKEITALVVVGANETLPCLTIRAGGTLDIYNGNGCGTAYPTITLTLSAGGTIDAGGTLGLYSSNSCDEGGDSTLVISGGALVNNGTIISSWKGPGPHTATGGHRHIVGDVTNYGTVLVRDALYLEGPATWDNQGAFDIQATGADTCQAWGEVTGKGLTFENGPKGSVSSAGLTGCAGQTTGLLRMDGGDTFIEAGPIVSGKGAVVLLQASRLEYKGPGAGKIELQGATALSGDIAKGQTLILDGSSGFCQLQPAVVTAATGFTNAGTITWACSVGSVSLSVTSGALTNTGAIIGLNVLAGNLYNRGTLSVGDNQVLTYQKGTFTNEGTLSVAGPNGLFSVPAGAGVKFLNGASGTVTNSGQFTMGSGNKFLEAGPINGTAPILTGDTLGYTGKAKSTIEVVGTTAISGNIAQHQTLLLYGTNGSCQSPSASVTAEVGFTNAGTITGACGGGPVTLRVRSGSLTNTGIVTAYPTSIDLAAHVDNDGTLESGSSETLVISSLDNYSASSHALNGGTYIANANSNGITVPGMEVHTLNANVTLDGGALSDGSNNALGNLSLIQGDLSLAQYGVTNRVSGGLTNAGRLTVGPDPSLDINGAYRQTSTGTFTSVVAGTSRYGALTVHGSASLAGTLAISEAPGYKPAAGATEQVLTYASRSGRFSAFDGTGAGAGLHFALRYTPVAAEVVVKTAG